MLFLTVRLSSHCLIVALSIAQYRVYKLRRSVLEVKEITIDFCYTYVIVVLLVLLFYGINRLL